MKNVYYTKKFEEHRKKFEVVFDTKPISSNEYQLSSQYRLEEIEFEDEIDGYNIRVAEWLLLDTQENAIYKWRCLDDNCSFQKILHHSNGNDYLLFRTDLYGYSVLNLTTMEDFHFYPDGSFPTGETFIWIDVFYNAENDMLAVDGCFWACPSGVILQDFKEPMSEPKVWIDVHEMLDKNYEKYDDIVFEAWQGDCLILSAKNSETDEKESLTITREQCMQWSEQKIEVQRYVT